MTTPSDQAYAEALASPPVLHTARLVLRRPERRDIPAIVRIAGDWEVASRLSRMPHPYTEDHARYFLAEIVPNELTWAMADRTSDAMIGAIGLVPRGEPAGTVELGYYVAPSHWGQGHATEAGSAVAAYGAGLVGQRRLRSGYFADNPASGRVLRKLGFVALHTAERPCLTTGHAKPSIEVGFPAADGP